jgi:hypothetical protein
MKGDFSRKTFERNRRFSRVLMQQGRVLLDADWNEQTSILLHYIRSAVADFGGPVAAIGDAFTISWIVDNDGNRVDNDFAIAPGHLYVDGILCEHERPTTYATQDEFPLGDVPPFSGTTLVYLDVWERHLTHLQHPAIREIALGGPDTTSRARVVWQVKIAPLEQNASCESVARDWDALVDVWQPRNRGRLQAWASRPPKVRADACITRPDARYRGLENRLYRVEVHRPGRAGEATFTWSRENGSVVLPLRSLSGVTAKVETFGADEPHSVRVGDWVEVIDDRLELLGEPGVLAEVKAIDPVDRTLELTPAGGSMPVFAGDSTTHPILRRWDHRQGVEQGGTEAADGALIIEEGVPIRLEDGIEVQFVPGPDGAGNEYRTGDHWLIPARTANGNAEWPSENGDALALEPFGVLHHYAPLAVITAAANSEPLDCLAPHRHRWQGPEPQT